MLRAGGGRVNLQHFVADNRHSLSSDARPERSCFKPSRATQESMANIILSINRVLPNFAAASMTSS